VATSSSGVVAATWRARPMVPKVAAAERVP
jgi:hypothetical protein